MSMKMNKCFDLHVLSEETRREMFSLDKTIADPYELVSPSAYDTAWLAIIEDYDSTTPIRGPMFPSCLDWILSNQNDVEGFWGNCDGHGNPTLETLTSTLACILALRRWNCGFLHVEKGKSYIERSTETVLENYTKEGSYPRWFLLMFCGMLEHVQQLCFDFDFSNRSKRIIKTLFRQRTDIFQREELMKHCSNWPPMAYLEALPSSYIWSQKDVTENLCVDGSLFRSPSATAAAFMITQNPKCLAYLKSIMQRCPQGVPQIYPIDEDLIKMSLLNLLENFGLSEYFNDEIEHVLSQIHRSYENKGIHAESINLVAEQLYKDSLAFRLLRIHGHEVSPRSFCWFLDDEEIQDYIEKNIECFSLVMLSVYRATDFMFNGESELEDARKLSIRFLKKSRSMDEKMIKDETTVPWMARPKHLDHRMRIEDKNSNALCIGKASFMRLNGQYSNKLTHLASKNFEFRQSLYRHELEDLKIWAKKRGLSEMGFGREKTTYCYFAIASSMSLPFDSFLRKIIAQGATIITVADDFFDEEGSLDDLKALTNAVLRWEGEGLKGHGLVIFEALDHLVREIADMCLVQHDTDITPHLRDIWRETFVSWLREAEWSMNGYIPSMEEYIQNGMVSIATHTLVLTSACLLDPFSFPKAKLKSQPYGTLTRLLMLIPRLLNDLQSYQKEQEKGKINSVLIHLNDHSSSGKIEDSIAHIEEILNTKRKDFLKHALMEGLSADHFSKQCKQLHLSCVKVFEMFFNKKNRYDSDTEMVQDIRKALYDPINVNTFEPPLTRHDKLIITPFPLKTLRIDESDNDKAKKEFPAIKSQLYSHQYFRSTHKPFFSTSLHACLKVKIHALATPSKISPCFY